ncbi:unnamed protein product [Phytophthora fragariaefolia]|uniref:Unnamed protein product n=1 Tax=Phytophthora fragariaefolia TaxID=1490495 RepID=A0A9W6XI86_9STRA|nr:unnamed protein product [Phytophthora fragariaefolia]
MCGIGLVLSPASSNEPSPSALVGPSSASSRDSGNSLHACNAFVQADFDRELQLRLCQRGPDHYQRVFQRVAAEFSGDSHACDWAIAMHSAVLHLRGDKVTPQPVSDSDANVLCWNGEVFGMDGDISTEREVDEVLMQGSDTLFLSEKLQAAGSKLQQMTVEEMETQGDPVIQLMRRVQGPFAMAWLHESTKRVYFAHDRFGRRSLLYRMWGGDGTDVVANLAGTEPSSQEVLQTDLARLVLSSVAIGNHEDVLSKFEELPAFGIYVLDLCARPSKISQGLASYRIEFHPYTPLAPMLPALTTVQKAGDNVMDRFGSKLPRPMATPEFGTRNVVSRDASELESSASALILALSNAVGVRVRSIPARPSSDMRTSPARVAVLFSGGLDSVVIAALTHFHVPDDEPVDLLTICFDESSAFTSPDRLAAELAHSELCALFPRRKWNLVKVNVARSELTSQQREVLTLMAPCNTHMDFNIGAAFWFLSRGIGELKETGQAPENATMEELNAFLKPRRADLRQLETEVAAIRLFGEDTKNSNALVCPVNRCGRKRKHGCIIGVCKSCCFKMQRAVEKLNIHESGDGQLVDPREAQGYRAKLISMGVQSESHLDLLFDLLMSKRQEEQEGSLKPTSRSNLSCRVHRAKKEQADEPEELTPASAVKICHSKENVYQTTARVVLVGIGADEQLAGYGRHRTALVNGGEDALRAELKVDLGRIWKRNLGRDDRCIASHGREARFPYLDESVVSAIATFPVSSLCDAELPRGEGDKRALRIVARALGLRSCAGLAKRAIQFGSRIAKVSNNGSNRQTQGVSTFSGIE